jgi:hypothetical protein
MSHLLPLFAAHLMLASWMRRLGVSGPGCFDAPSDLSQILRVSPTAQDKARALAREHGVNVIFELADVHNWVCFGVE